MTTNRLSTVLIAAAAAIGGMGGLVAIGPSVAHADPMRYQPCTDRGKLAYDSSASELLVCNGSLSWGLAPDVRVRVQPTGSPCQLQGMEATSPDGYLLMCDNGSWDHYWL